VTPPPQERALPLPVLAAPSARAAEPSVAVRLTRYSNDEDLMARVRLRDAEALDALFERYSRLVLGIALRILRNHGEAEDTVQETFFYLYKRAELFDPAKGSVKAWIVEVAFHRALDRKLHLGRRGYYLGTEVDSVDDTLLGATDLDREIGARIIRTQLERAFAELPEAQRRTLEMFYFEGLEFREIAEELDAALGNIRHHYYRGLERLRKSAFVGALR
jgi:RNA polymerase sigma-70 factor (ECF subfamily)